MDCHITAGGIRAVPYQAAEKRLLQIAEIARHSSHEDAICRNWAPDRFAEIEELAEDLLESPPHDLAAMAMDLLHCLRVALKSDMVRLTNLLEELYDRPDWRFAYLCYFVPFSLAVLSDVLDLGLIERACGA